MTIEVGSLLIQGHAAGCQRTPWSHTSTLERGPASVSFGVRVRYSACSDFLSWAWSAETTHCGKGRHYSFLPFFIIPGNDSKVAYFAKGPHNCLICTPQKMSGSLSFWSWRKGKREFRIFNRRPDMTDVTLEVVSTMGLDGCSDSLLLGNKLPKLCGLK